ncbi:uncharacterized protein BJ212DRAFT_1322734 [Suillus subaureus]|uniref:Uncharacterized protein n=1 Tax=Suillus subaureus TaxID=48587 RepID=A0A9P7ELR7_9AGAM|nr:uncharacterized protein BJ212DRAFT_1322734 [Suillus subaureus]KAG1824837.1 hypothetical protein BJ212DRAFT_1322734 [Suillus subaureus]
MRRYAYFRTCSREAWSMTCSRGICSVTYICQTGLGIGHLTLNSPNNCQVGETGAAQWRSIANNTKEA